MIALWTTTLLMVTRAPSPPCFLLSDQTAGWKRVDLPSDAPALAAPPGIDQFRSSEPVLELEHDARTYVGAVERPGGRSEYRFRVSAGTRHLHVQFAQALRGAKVNVTALAGQQSYPVIRERRIPAAELWADWDIPDVDWVVVKVYHHLRPTPVIARWQTGHWQSPTMQPEVPEAFRVPRSLYLRHPGGRRLELCDAPGQRLELEERTLQGEVSHATVSSSTAH